MDNLTFNIKIILYGFMVALISIISVLCNAKLILLIFLTITLLTILICNFRLYTLITFCYILFVPKLSLFNINGVHVGIRGEDFLILLFCIRFITLICANGNFIISDKYMKIIKCFSVYMLICVIATALAIHKGYITNYGVACLYLLRKIEYFMVGFMGYYFYKSEKDNDTINKLLNASIVIFTIISILQLTGKIGGFALGEYSQNVSDRVIATFSGAYEYSAFLSIVFFKFLYDINYKRHKIFDFFMLVIIMFNIIITKSRISLIAVIAIFIYFFIKSKVSFLKKFLVLDLAIIFSVLFLQLAPNLLDSKSMERFRTINLKDMYTSYKFTMQRGNLQRFLVAGYATYNSSTDLSFDIRVSKWADMFDGFKQNPFWGIGVSTTGEAIDGNYIRYLAESGILGFMAWLLFILTVTKQIINIRRNWLQSMLFYGLMALFINAIFIDIFEASKVMMTYWFLVGILFKSDKLENSIDNVKHKNKKIQIVWGDKKLMG